MIVTLLMYKSLNNLTKSFKYLFSCPLEWDGKLGILIFNPILSKKMLPWVWSVFGGMLAVIFTCSTLIICHNYGKIDVKFKDLVLSVLFLCMSSFAFIEEVVILLYGKDFAYSINVLTAMFARKGTHR